MNSWTDFFVTLLIRAVVAGVPGFFIGMFVRVFIWSPIPVSWGGGCEMGFIGAAVGAISAMLTIPRQHRPWC